MSHDFTPPPMPGYGPQFPPPPPPPPKKANTVLVAGAAAVVAAVLASLVTVTVTGGGDGGAEAAPTVTVTETELADGTGADAETEADTGDEPTPEETGDGAYTLSDTVSYENDVDISLSKFSRGVSHDYASPENTPYVKFTIKVVNGATSTFDATSMTVNCAHGDEGKEGEAIFDDGLDGTPDTSILAGRSLSFTWGCELPKTEKYLQIEVSPDFDSETAIYAGSVKRAV
ncbi:hypothetical protein OG352_04565 [Streptomyces sp. NBC_01485]|uniref:hypothetical protein n=1 Tax=Streptomyces sp. NBC_01485 TaxID=2903884 RepID=UPI002E35EB43|nr:hypothetical protein [Streptomyces sp. NBC_01485]